MSRPRSSSKWSQTPGIRRREPVNGQPAGVRLDVRRAASLLRVQTLPARLGRAGDCLRRRGLMMQLTPEQQEEIRKAKAAGDKRVTTSFTSQQKEQWDAAVQEEFASKEENLATSPACQECAECDMRAKRSPIRFFSRRTAIASRSRALPWRCDAGSSSERASQGVARQLVRSV